jgi:23S rRNA (cytosine1962-C5)-methyltransferase
MAYRWETMTMAGNRVPAAGQGEGAPTRIARPVPGARLNVLTTAGFPDYALLDSGDGRKLERFGQVTVERPEPQAMWRPALEPNVWHGADASFKSEKGQEDGDGGRWRTNTSIPEAWPVSVLGVNLLCRLTSFRHLGIFPEQVVHWQWMLNRLAGLAHTPPRLLNLFAYTGAASLIAARAGAEVTHVDASKKAIAWAKQNQFISELGAAPIRWILEDARKFVAREVRRGKAYHIILIDPPKFGRGPSSEVWDVFAHLAPLLRDCVELLARPTAALVLTTYAIRASALATDGLVRDCLAGRGGTIESGELAVVEQTRSRLLPTSMFTTWVSDETTS